MKFVAYFELNQNLDPAELAEVGLDLMKRKLYPAEGYKTLAWYTTPGM